MKISLILNTSCMDPLAGIFKSQWRKKPYAARIEILRETIALAQDDGWDEIIVAGQYEDGPNYKYIEVEPVFRNRSDGLIQREMGARYATGDVLVFCHDDHRPGNDHDNFVKTIRARFKDPNYDYDWDLLIPKRIHNITGETLENGNHEQNPKRESYMGAHCLVMKRWLWAEVPWTSVATTFWDHSMTRLWKEAGAKLVYADDLIHYDMEAEEDET